MGREGRCLFSSLLTTPTSMVPTAELAATGVQNFCPSCDYFLMIVTVPKRYDSEQNEYDYVTGGLKGHRGEEPNKRCVTDESK